PGGMGERYPTGSAAGPKLTAPVGNDIGHVAFASLAQMPALGVAADQQHKLELRHEPEDPFVPGRRAFAAWRQVTAHRVVAGKAEAHGYDGHTRLIVEFLRRYAEPCPESIARRIGEWPT